jgi:hypothetical protein
MRGASRVGWQVRAIRLSCSHSEFEIGQEDNAARSLAAPGVHHLHKAAAQRRIARGSARFAWRRIGDEGRRGGFRPSAPKRGGEDADFVGSCEQNSHHGHGDTRVTLPFGPESRSWLDGLVLAGAASSTIECYVRAVRHQTSLATFARSHRRGWRRRTRPDSGKVAPLTRKVCRGERIGLGYGRLVWRVS